ncbi:MAG: NADPH-dependent assimilatory sulfite reductase hemoprotein subunit [Saprospiraceae bacterium]|nr:NADPH-dependent assimilatory sulfite reductase hemoprotein subunit [Saprospiraceae bacterium]
MAEKKLSEVEIIKENSDYLRGSLVQSLDNKITGALYPDDTQLIKFHGAYQQTDRDLESERKTQKLEPLYSMMIRIRVPAGVATPAQWLRMDELASKYGNGTMKLTTRQAFQLHGIRKRHLKATIQGFNEVMLDSIAGCGDVNRNVMCSPNPNESKVHAAVWDISRQISAEFTPKTSAYYEIWMDGQPVDESQPFNTQPQDAAAAKDAEPIYGKTYLPRKFKIAIAVPPYNDTDIFANDIGLIAIEKDGELEGFNVAAGGGLGMTFGMPETFPRLADMLGYIDKKDVLKVCEAIITTQRDNGNRENRKFSRLKYTIERMGLAAFQQEVERRAGLAFQEAKSYKFIHSGDPLGWTKTHDGHYNLGLFIEGGRIIDYADYPLRTALRVLASVHEGDFRLTGNQNLVIGHISAEKKPVVEAILDKYGVLQATYKQTALRQNSIACVALNTCSLAFAEAERYLPSLIDKIDLIIRAHGLEKDAINIRMTGCPNGCGRPYLGEIAFIGKSPGRYNLYLGAAHNGERMNKLYREMLDEAGILAELEPIIGAYARERERNETFGDFVIRQGYVKATTHGTNFHD